MTVELTEAERQKIIEALQNVSVGGPTHVLREHLIVTDAILLKLMKQPEPTPPANGFNTGNRDTGV